MRPRTIDALAKETGLDPHVLDYLRKNPGEQNRLQRLMASERTKETLAEQQTETVHSTDEFVGTDETGDSENRYGRKTRTQTRQTRLETRVYVEALAESASTQDGKQQADKRSRTSKTGVQKVLDYERTPKSKPAGQV